MEIHLWQAYNPKKISVNISRELKEKIKKCIKKDIKNISKKTKINPARLYEYFIYQSKPIPLDKLITISKLMKLSLLEIEKEITMYKQMYVPIKNSIKSPKLPLEINPYFTSIVSHLFFDGSVPKDGKGTYYNQKEKEIMNDFINKINYVFGNVSYCIKKDHRGVLKCRLPRMIGEICKKTYNIDSFGTFDAKIPEKIFKLNKNHKKAFILSAILDEGSIGYDGNIYFGVSNEKLCEDVKKLCEKVKLDTSKIILKNKEKNHYYFRITSKKELLNLINSFKEKYPLISLNYKEKRLKHYFKTLECPGIRTKKGGNNRKKQILSLIKEKEKSPNKLSVELKIPVRTIRRHLYSLINQEKVKRRKCGNNYLYISLQPH